MPAPRNYLDDKRCVETLLARWPDDRRFYKVELISHDEKNNKSLVKFEDGESYPIATKDLHIQLNLDNITDDAIMCCLCESAKGDAPNVIVICDLCQLGYHVGCHQPPIEAVFLDDSDKEWYCETCLEITHPDRVRKRKRKSTDEASREPITSIPSKSKQTPKKSLKSPTTKTSRKTPSSKIISSTPRKANKKQKVDQGSESSAVAVIEYVANEVDEQVIVNTDKGDNPDNKDAHLDKADKQVEHDESIVKDKLEEEPSKEVALISDADRPQDLRIGDGNKIEELTNGTTVEEMDATVIEAAKSLSNSVETDDFVTSIVPPDSTEAIKPDTKKTKSKRVIKVKFARTKDDSVKPEPA